MKKNLYIMMGLIVVAISCTKSGLIEAPEKQQTSIEFDTYTGKTPVTKASSVTIETLGENTGENYPVFQVTAFQDADYASPYMSKAVWCESMTLDNPETEANEFSASWKYSGKKYWPESGDLLFVAYGLNVDDDYFVPTQNSSINFTYTVPEKALEQKDLIVAVPVTQGISSGSSTVSLDFKHLLSRIGFTLQTTQQNEVNIIIKSIKLQGKFFNQGEVNLTAVGEDDKPFISPVGDGEVMTYSFFASNFASDGKTKESDDCYQINNVPSTGYGIYPNKILLSSNGTIANKDNSDENNRYMMIIPDGEPTKLEVTYQLEGAEAQTIPVDLSSMENYDSFKKLEAGKAYEFVMRLSTDKIEFSGEVKTWPTTVPDTNIPRN